MALHVGHWAENLAAVGEMLDKFRNVNVEIGARVGELELQLDRGVERVHVHLRRTGSGEWRGRAGSYAIQGLGSALVDTVRGDVSNVIGLPVGLLLRLAPEVVQER